MGGVWPRAAITLTEGSTPSGPSDAGRTPNTADDNETPCPDEGCTKGACIDGMVLQQSCP
jgi:hypothetical protein